MSDFENTPDASVPQRLPRKHMITFRVNRLELQRILQTTEALPLSRSAFLRALTATGSVVYVGQDLAERFGSCRADLARSGTLLKNAGKCLGILTENPLLNDDDRELLRRVEEDLLRVCEEQRKIHARLIRCMEKLNRDLDELNGG